jgi:hypothetical protein
MNIKQAISNSTLIESHEAHSDNIGINFHLRHAIKIVPTFEV